ncbi:MAG: signal peptidase I [Bacteroidales bacterium]|jgi:signal peptidase I
MKKYKSYIKWSLWALLVLLVFRLFFFQVVRTADFHMASTLLPGDRVMVNKFRTGLRLPIAIIGLPGPSSPYADGIRLPYMRLPALKKIQRQEVLVFNLPAGTDKPIDRKRLMISRVVGLPGDTVMILDKQLVINNKNVAPPVTSRSEFRVITEGKQIGDDFLRKHDLEKPRTIADIGIYDFDLSKEDAGEIGKIPGVRTVRETKHYLGDGSGEYYPVSNFFKWNRDQYGPFIVPKKGMSVPVDIRSIDFYRDIIENHEGHEVMVDYAGVHIDGNIPSTYTFEKDYYFVLSDSRDNPDDSRLIGFVPEDHMLGVAKRILWSGQRQYQYLKKFHAGRILKKIR